MIMSFAPFVLKLAQLWRLRSGSGCASASERGTVDIKADSADLTSGDLREARRRLSMACKLEKEWKKAAIDDPALKTLWDGG